MVRFPERESNEQTTDNSQGELRQDVGGLTIVLLEITLDDMVELGPDWHRKFITDSRLERRRCGGRGRYAV